MLSPQVFTIIFGFSLQSRFKSSSDALIDQYLAIFLGSVDAYC